MSLVCWVSDRRLSGVLMSRTGEAGPRLLVWTNKRTVLWPGNQSEDSIEYYLGEAAHVGHSLGARAGRQVVSRGHVAHA